MNIDEGNLFKIFVKISSQEGSGSGSGDGETTTEMITEIETMETSGDTETFATTEEIKMTTYDSIELDRRCKFLEEKRGAIFTLINHSKLHPKFHFS